MVAGQHRLAFAGGPLRASDIYKVRADGSEVTRLTGVAGDDWGVGPIWADGPTWSPDGTWVAFGIWYDSNYLLEGPLLVVIDADGWTDLRYGPDVTGLGPGLQPAWRPANP